MTISICLKVGDGLVFGADSASSIMSDVGVFNVYSTAEKIINLRKGLPIGAVTYGLGGLGGRSITSLAKGLRLRLQPGGDWALDVGRYTMQEVAGRVRQYFFEELYEPEFAERRKEFDEAKAKGQIPADKEFPYQALGFLVGGFSAGSPKAEVWEVEVGWDGKCPDPALLFEAEDAGFIAWKGEPEALNRLLYGHADEAIGRLLQAGLDRDTAYQLLTTWVPVAHPAMPIQDAIDLVRYLAEVTAGFVRFRPGANTVSGPIDLAAITLYEGFRWVARKHYYPAQLNPAATHTPEKAVDHIQGVAASPAISAAGTPEGASDT